MKFHAIVELILMIADWIDDLMAKRRQKKAQESRDELEADPNDWFDEHFGPDADWMRDGAEGAKPAAHQTNPDNRTAGKEDSSGSDTSR